MTMSGDVAPAPQSPALAAGALAAPAAPPLAENQGASLSHFQEINERRARVENAELLQQLRGL
jgi:hypothetical protein